jgi:hypothetical protein
MKVGNVIDDQSNTRVNSNESGRLKRRTSMKSCDSTSRESKPRAFINVGEHAQGMLAEAHATAESKRA